jgi:hypothetical protein
MTTAVTSPRALGGRRPRNDTVEEVSAMEVASPRRRVRADKVSSPSTSCAVNFSVKTKMLGATWAVTSTVDLGSTIKDEARIHEYTTLVSWSDVELFAAQAEHVIPHNLYLVPLPLRGPVIRKILNAICDSKGEMLVLNFLNADACLQSEPTRSVRVFSRQLSSDSLLQLGVM